MQETRNNCFGSKKRSTTLLQAKTGKHECRNVTARFQSVIKPFIKTPVYGAHLTRTDELKNRCGVAFTQYSCTLHCNRR